MDEGPPGWAVPLHERVLAGVEPGTAVLDVACGPGTFLAFADGRAMTVSGADPDPSALAVAGIEVPDADLRRADAHTLPWSDGSFGLVVLVQAGAHDQPGDGAARGRPALRTRRPGARHRAGTARGDRDPRRRPVARPVPARCGGRAGGPAQAVLRVLDATPA